MVTFVDQVHGAERYRGFNQTFKEEHYGWPVYGDWQLELFNYFIEGYHPGSFHRALFENDLLAAASRSHPTNHWQWIVGFMKWLANKAPPNSWGSPEKVTAWLALSKEERYEIVQVLGWRMSDAELTWAKVSK